MDTGHKVDTLSTRQRIALRTNAFEWLCLTPNIGVEYDLTKFNYGRWALTLMPVAIGMPLILISQA